jgi:hypothetical protein
MNIPSGFVIVPIDPTEEMILGFWGEVTKGAPEISAAKEAYADMISAAPPVEIPAYDEAKERELFANAMHDMGRCSSVSGVLDDGGLYYFKSEWEIWQACAKSRAGIQS